MARRAASLTLRDSPATLGGRTIRFPCQLQLRMPFWVSNTLHHEPALADPGISTQCSGLPLFPRFRTVSRMDLERSLKMKKGSLVAQSPFSMNPLARYFPQLLVHCVVVPLPSRSHHAALGVSAPWIANVLVVSELALKS